MISENPKPEAMISEKNLPAIYPKDSLNYLHFEKLVIASPTEENFQKYESASQMQEYRVDLQDLDQYSPLELLKVLNQLETHL